MGLEPSADGVGNLAPHSFFTVACADPGVVQFTSVGAKDTLRNVQETGEFVVNVAPRWLLEQVNNSSARFDAGTFEAEALGIVMEPSDLVAPARVADSPGALECRLHSTVDFGTSTVVFGTVVAASIKEDILDGTTRRWRASSRCHGWAVTSGACRRRSSGSPAPGGPRTSPGGLRPIPFK